MLTHLLLDELGVAHAFGTRGEAEIGGLLRARQVHGARVVEASSFLSTQTSLTHRHLNE